MYRASRQDKSLWCMLLSSKVGLIFIVTFFCASLSHSYAQIQDVTPPTLTALSFTPTTIDTASGPASVAVSVSATDDLAGVAFVGVGFRSPSGAHNYISSQSFSPATSVSGTINVPFPQFSEVGTWTVFVGISDAINNGRNYSTTEVAQLGFPTELVVVGEAEDVTPPVISVSATPQTLWPPNGRMVPVTISGTITDLESGVNASTATYEVKDEYGLIQPSGQITTLDASGRSSCRSQLQASRRGNDRDGRQYTITISAQDNEGNQGSKSTVVIVPHDQS
jgi:hypothetical protein